jgi:hypothetical protein
MFNDKEILELKQYTQSIINKPRPIDAQPHERRDDKIFCEDWEIIEICKYIFNGASEYKQDPPPNRLKNNPLWSKEDIIRKAEALIAEVGSMDKIIQIFKQKRLT